MKTAVLFAGQGSQTVGMGKDLYDNYEEFRRVFDLLTPEEQQIAWGFSSPGPTWAESMG